MVTTVPGFTLEPARTDWEKISPLRRPDRARTEAVRRIDQALSPALREQDQAFTEALERPRVAPAAESSSPPRGVLEDPEAAPNHSAVT
jgi:hypothetical protein